MNLLKKQRDAIGLSVFSDTYEYYALKRQWSSSQNGVKCAWESSSAHGQKKVRILSGSCTR
jgi:hypothetical protein